MRFPVDEKILQKASGCPHDFMCQKSEEICLCFIDKPCEGFLHIAQKTHEKCPYMKEVGNYGFICTCPVRIEIYKVYKR